MAYQYDPDRALWKPTRRFFFMGFGAAVVSTFLPALPEIRNPRAMEFAMRQERLFSHLLESVNATYRRDHLRLLKASPIEITPWRKIDGHWSAEMRVPILVANPGPPVLIRSLTQKR